MLLVQKQPNLPTSPVPHHRRHPSAPPVVVQPTRTPGLLSLSKPPRPSPARPQQVQLQQQQRIRSTPKPKSAPRPAQPPTITAATPLTLVHADNAETRTPAKRTSQAHEKSQPRGRQHSKPQKSLRSTSQSPHNNGRRNNNRQPSPPHPDFLINTSPAEGFQTPTKNKADPFLDDSPANKLPSLSTSATLLQQPPPPTLSPRPSGKLARRRQQQQLLRPAPSSNEEIASSTSKPIPLNAKPIDIQPLARSEPRPIPTSHRAKENTPVFPVCDDTDDALYPTTPTRPRHKAGIYQPKTAPPRAPAPNSYFPSPTSSPVATQEKSRHGVRRHNRAPSGGVFDMSSDEEPHTLSSTPSGALTPNVEALFNLAVPQRGSISASSSSYIGAGLPSSLPLPSASSPFGFSQPTTVPRTRESREKQLEREAAAAVAAYFASSNFQNSPSPDELPPPDF
ncbi:hypothetical protein AX16_004381 [Volvariella volvacea WC 439]|nr:hypothetical protein AX16_004381 [Volvariella volvacea WC 439]